MMFLFIGSENNVSGEGSDVVVVFVLFKIHLSRTLLELVQSKYLLQLEHHIYTHGVFSSGINMLSYFNQHLIT